MYILLGKIVLKNVWCLYTLTHVLSFPPILITCQQVQEEAVLSYYT